MSFDDYKTINAVNRSSLSLVRKSEMHYRYYQAGGDDSPHLQFGSLAHHGKLEPAELSKRYVVLPPFENDIRRSDGTEYAKPKATSAYAAKVKEFMAKHPTKVAVDMDWLQNLAGMMHALDEHPKAKVWFGTGYPEVTVVWESQFPSGDTIRCKARIDWLHTSPTTGIIDIPPGKASTKVIRWLMQNVEMIVDLKTTMDVSEFYLDKWDYHLQAPYYVDGIAAFIKREAPFGFVAVEKARPFAVRAAPVKQSVLETGRMEYAHLLERVQIATKRRKWPGPPDPVDGWDVSPWFRSQFSERIPA
jgi:hypothetical protein